MYEEVDGRRPAIPWRMDELGRVEGMLAALSDALHPSPWQGAPTFAEVNGDFMEHSSRPTTLTQDCAGT